ncbi:MAG: ABC transporter ATP-binding protein [Granulosicoccus sp.]
MNSQTRPIDNSAPGDGSAPANDGGRNADHTVLSGQKIAKRVSGPEGTLTILHELDIDIYAGEAVAIVGPSGSGKSTLLGILAGLDTPSEGTVNLLNQPISTLDEDARARLRAGRVGFVFQSFQLLPGLSALENVMLPLELTGEAEASERARAMLEQVGLDHRAGHQPLQLSGGEQQRVALARAFVSQPALLFADEPTGNLDSETGEKVVELMFSLREQQGSAVVLVTHDNALAERCDRVLRMGNGRLEAL